MCVCVESYLSFLSMNHTPAPSPDASPGNRSVGGVAGGGGKGWAEGGGLDRRGAEIKTGEEEDEEEEEEVILQQSMSALAGSIDSSMKELERCVGS